MSTGDGEITLQELLSKYNKVTDEVIQANMDRLVNFNMEQEEDADLYFMEQTLSRSELEKIGDIIFDRRFNDICVQEFTAEYKDTKMMTSRVPTFYIDQMQCSMRHLYLDDLCRNSDPKIAVRGVAMTAAWTYSHCAIQYARKCWTRKENDDNKSTGAHNKQ